MERSDMWVRRAWICVWVGLLAGCGGTSSDPASSEGGDESSTQAGGGEETGVAAEGGGATGDPVPEEGGGLEGGVEDHPIMAQAKALYPKYKNFHQLAMNPKCGPVGGVCHNTKEFPDLHTAANMLDAIGLLCNVLADGPEVIENLCEPSGDVLVITSGQDVGFLTEIGSLYAVPGDMECDDPAVADLPDDLPQDQDLCMTLAKVVPLGAAVGEGLVNFSIVRPDPVTNEQLVLVQYEARLETQQASNVVRFVDFGILSPYEQDAFLYTVYQGDMNGDGVFGAQTDENGLLIKPGDPLQSYIVWRIMGWGLAPRMPLAEEPMTPMMQLAMMCWIKHIDAEVGSTPEDVIPYDDCAEFLEVVDPLEEEEEGDEGDYED